MKVQRLSLSPVLVHSLMPLPRGDCSLTLYVERKGSPESQRRDTNDVFCGVVDQIWGLYIRDMYLYWGMALKRKR